MQHLAARFHPVVEKRRLHLRHYWAFYPEVGVSPVIGILASPHLLFSSDYPACKSCGAVEHQELSVGAIVELRKVISS